MGERDDLRIRLAEMLAKNEEVLTLANVCIQEVAATRTEHSFSVGAMPDKIGPFPHSAATTILNSHNTISDSEDGKTSEESTEKQSSDCETATSSNTTTLATSLDEGLDILAGMEGQAATFESQVNRTEKIKRRLTLLLEESKDLEQLFQEYDEMENGDDKKMVSKKDVRKLKRDMQKELKDRKRVTSSHFNYFLFSSLQYLFLFIY